VPPVTRQRIDKWLWFARIVKTRSLAAGLVEAGQVRINRHRATKPGHAVAVGDVLTISFHGPVRVLKVAACAERRGRAPAAQLLYQDLAMSIPDGPTSQKKDASGAGNC
jgi:ribosome-associated heat shock protein Hsp15